MGMPRAERPYMPDYGVDTPAWEPPPWSWTAERLTKNLFIHFEPERAFAVIDSEDQLSTRATRWTFDGAPST